MLSTTPNQSSSLVRYLGRTERILKSIWHLRRADVNAPSMHLPLTDCPAGAAGR